MLNNKYKILSLALISISSKALSAQEAAKEAVIDTDSALNWMYENVIFLVAGGVILINLFALWFVIRSLMEHQKNMLFELKGIESPEAAALATSAASTSIWQQFSDWAWKIVPIDKEKTIDLGHDYDGIRELDNRLPPWWLWMFYATIAFGVVYMYVYHWSDIGVNQAEEYEIAMEIAEEQKIKRLAAQANLVDETSVVALSDEASLSRGATAFKVKCAACHGMEGQGGVGPNLTDDYWIHGGSVNDIFKTIKYGVPEKGMISWQSQMNPLSMQQVSSYILTLQGTNPPNPKEPQGEKYIPQEKALNGDTVKQKLSYKAE